MLHGRLPAKSPGGLFLSGKNSSTVSNLQVLIRLLGCFGANLSFECDVKLGRFAHEMRICHGWGAQEQLQSVKLTDWRRRYGDND